VVPRLYVALTTAWFASCRLKIRGNINPEQVLAQGAVVLFWHYSFFYMFYLMHRYPGVVMVSASKDGEYIARVARLLGFETVRGSANRFGVRALKGMVDHMKQGKNGGIVADGSQGPALRVQPGAVMVAAKSGFPIMPVVVAAQRYKTFNSWDHTILPMPFSRVIVEYGTPIHVPEKLSSEIVEQYRQQLETEMLGMYDRLWQEFGRKDHVHVQGDGNNG